MAFDNEIFEGKTLSDMFSDVYNNTEAKRNQINSFIANMVKLMRTVEDAAVMGPVVADFLEVNVKNDEHIVRLVQIAQRLIAMNTKSGDNELLTEDEKQQLLKNVKMDFEAVLAEQDTIQDAIDGIKQ